MTRLGYILLTLAFLSCAYVASLDPKETDWQLFLPAAIAGAFGVFMVKRANKLASRDQSRLQGNRKDLEDSLANIVAKLDKLRADKDSIPPFELRFEIDKLFRDDLMRFADARQALAHLYGLQAYADVMSDFAAGERYINRVWSASADGYVDEAHRYIHRACDQFKHAAQRLSDIQQHRTA